jgi:transposase
LGHGFQGGFGMRKKRPRHTSEFKAEAVSLHHASKQSLQKTALSIGIGKSTLSIGIGKSTLLSWVQQAAIAAGGERPGALTTDERAELIVLRRENRQVKLARDFLKSQRYRSQGNSVMPREMIQAEATIFSITMMCGLLSCSRSGYYAQKKPDSQRSAWTRWAS